jgi:predicted permease
MRWVNRVAARLRSLFRRSHVEQALDRELRFHLEQQINENLAAGMSLDQARAAASRSLGSLLLTKDQCRESLGLRLLDELRQDVRYASRSLVKNPGFTIVAVLTLALGIGINGAVFAVLKSALLDALPYADADRLVRVYSRMLDGSSERGPLSAGTIADIADRQRSFTGLAAFVDARFDEVYGAEKGSRVVTVAWVEPAVFETLGVRVTHGRLFQPDDRTTAEIPFSGGQIGRDTARSVLLTDGGWKRLFAGEADVLGREVRIGGLPRTVIGILPAGFLGPMGDVDFYFAFDLGPVVAHPTRARGSTWLGLVGRLKPGVSENTVQRELADIGADLARVYPRENGLSGLTAMPLRDALVGDTRTPLLVVTASAALVLLIACANLTGALLSRTLSRRKEFGVRLALGAGRARLARQLLTESAVLALAGGTTGVLLAGFLLSVLRGVTLPALPGYVELILDRGTVMMTAGMALCAGLAVGVAPALAVDRSNSQAVLRDAARTVTENPRGRRLRGALVASQIALCVSLLVGAGLLVRSLWAMTTAPLGFRADGVLTAFVQLPPRDYGSAESRVRFTDQFTERLGMLPGVTGVADASALPTAASNRVGIVVAGDASSERTPSFVLIAVISDDYFRALGIPLRQGRTFDAHDRMGTLPTVVISEGMARRYWPRGDAVGSRIRMGADPNSPLTEVIGIVGDVRNDRARPDAEPMAYRSSRQVPRTRMAFLIRTDGNPLGLLRPVERTLAEIDAGLALQRATTLRTLVGEGLGSRRWPVLLTAAFGVLALLLASIGVYAMFSIMAVAREREFGLRMALGSRRLGIAAMVLREGANWMVAGLVGGLLGAVIAVRLVRDLLYGVPPFDPVALGGAIMLFLACATVALLAPVRRATKVDPLVALRSE